jgi:CBS domain-containing protein
MIQGCFRHLPVMDDESDVVGILDITKCLYSALERIQRIYGSSKKLTEALEDVQRDWATSGINPAMSQQFELIRQRMLCPDLSSILSAENLMPPELNMKATVRDAVKAMKQCRSTACLIFEEGHRLAGIFTTKDIVLRVLAIKAHPATTSIIRVMTPHPDTCDTSTSIYDALKMMHDHAYLHLPVVDSISNDVVGLVDVLKLTYNVLEKVNSVKESDGPAWNAFWNATFAPETLDGESVMSHSPTSQADATLEHPMMIRPSDSASMLSETGQSGILEQSRLNASVLSTALDPTFVFKFRDPTSMQVHRVTAPTTSLTYLVALIKEKIGPHAELNILSYVDEDGDEVMVQCDADLLAAVAMARDSGIKRILLIVNGVRSSADAIRSGTPPHDTNGSAAGSECISGFHARDSYPKIKKDSPWGPLLDHPAAMVAIGCVATLSLVGLAALFRR